MFIVDQTGVLLFLYMLDYSVTTITDTKVVVIVEVLWTNCSTSGIKLVAIGCE